MLCPEAYQANSACMSKLQWQMHFGEKPYEYCRKVLVLTLLFAMAEHRFSDTRQLRIVGTHSWLIFKYSGPCQREDVYLPVSFLARSWQHSSLGGWGEHRGLSLGLAFPVQCVPQPLSTLPAAAPPSEMAQQCPGTPETLL